MTIPTQAIDRPQEIKPPTQASSVSVNAASHGQNVEDEATLTKTDGVTQHAGPSSTTPTNGKLCATPGCGKAARRGGKYCSSKCVENYQKSQHPVVPKPTKPNGDATKLTSTEESEKEAKKYCQQILTHVKDKNGCFLVEEREDGNEYSILIGKRRTPVNVEKNNHALIDLLFEVCDISRSAKIAPSLIDRLGYEARKAANKLKLRKFSAMSSDGKRLYWPLADSMKLLRITAEGREIVDNGTNDDHLWLEIPVGAALDEFGDGIGLEYKEADPKEGLAAFERLIVENQACRVPEMRWFVAMQEALYPGVRDLNAHRILVRHSGDKNNGKTSGAQFVAAMHGLRYFFNVTEAYLRRNIRDCGVMVIDNLEEEDQSRSMQRHQLASATGGGGGRCGATSDKYRPVEVYCSITGSSKPEIESRYVVVDYHLDDDHPLLNLDSVLLEIRQKRHLMLSALMPVYQRFLQTNQEQRSITVPREIRAPGNFTAIARLLYAYADVAQKSAVWADAIVDGWRKTIAAEKAEIEGDEYTALIEMLINEITNVDGKDVDYVDAFLYECFKKGQTARIADER